MVSDLDRPIFGSFTYVPKLLEDEKKPLKKKKVQLGIVVEEVIYLSKPKPSPSPHLKQKKKRIEMILIRQFMIML